MRQGDFTIEDRENLLKYLSQGLSICKIPLIIGKDRSSIYRELSDS